jgi:AcrR family transcriptional regulator
MDTPQRIVDAALAVFGRYGYRQASMEAVAEQAGLSRQALYRHFPTKETLFEAVVEGLHGASLGAAAEAARAARARGDGAAEVLLAQLDARSGYILSRLHGSAHAPELLDENNRRCGAIAAAAGERFAAQLASTVRSERRAGRLALKQGLSPDSLTRLLIAAARGIKSAVPPPGPEAFRRELASMVELLVGGAIRPAGRRARQAKRGAGAQPERSPRAGGPGRGLADRRGKVGRRPARSKVVAARSPRD